MVAAASVLELPQPPCALWFTGLPAAGKSTIANLVELELRRHRRLTCTLDGDQIRRGLSRDLGFTAADRAENVRRVAEVAKLMVDAGLVVLVTLISPFAGGRAAARSLFAPGLFFEIHVDTPLEVAAGRDPKGLYAKARRGDLANLTGIDSPYERPVRPELRLDTERLSPEQCAQQVLSLLELGLRTDVGA